MAKEANSWTEITINNTSCVPHKRRQYELELDYSTDAMTSRGKSSDGEWRKKAGLLANCRLPPVNSVCCVDWVRQITLDRIFHRESSELTEGFIFFTLFDLCWHCMTSADTSMCKNSIVTIYIWCIMHYASINIHKGIMIIIVTLNKTQHCTGGATCNRLTSTGCRPVSVTLEDMMYNGLCEYKGTSIRV